MPLVLKYVRLLHSWFGVIALPWVIFFGLTGFYLNHPDAVRTFLPLQSYEENTNAFPILAQPLTADAAADIARSFWPESKMLSVKNITYHGNEAFQFERDAGYIIVAKETGHYYVKSRIQNKMFSPEGELLERKIYWNYVFGVFHRTGWFGWSIGTILADITAFSLMIFGFSGLILWYLPKHKRFKRKILGFIS